MGPRSLDQIREGEVPAGLAGLYREVRRTLRLTWVPLYFRALAPHPDLLRHTWRALRPAVGTRAFEQAADDLRAHAVRLATELGTPLLEPVLLGAGLDVDALDELRAQLRLFHYADAKELLAVAVAVRAASDEGTRATDAGDATPVPAGPPPDMAEPRLAPESPGGIAGEIFREILEATHLPAAEIDVRALGHWPSFLSAAWPELAPALRRRKAEPGLELLVRHALRLAARLPLVPRLGPGSLEDAERYRPVLARLNAIFLDALPRLALFTSAASVALEGPENALASPFPIEGPEGEGTELFY